MGVKKYLKRPESIEAIQYTGLNKEEIKAFCPTVKFISNRKKAHDTLIVPTPVGISSANTGDYITKNIQGEFYVYKKELFLDIYEEVK